MTDRIKILREQSLNAINTLSAERALLVTDWYSNHESAGYPVPVMRALAFDHILRNKTIFIDPLELITGERGPRPKATPTYPEINLHTPEDLEILDTREKVFFRVDEKTKNAYRDIVIPYWSGKSNREVIMRTMEPEWLEAYRAGIFTEFQEQRAPGHTVCGNKIYRKGMLDLLDEIEISKQTNPGPAENEELKAMAIAASALIHFAERHAVKLEEHAASESDGERKSSLLKLAAICRKVPAHAPETFHEALQYYWFVHLGVITELNPWDSFNPGRLDQHLFPFYQKEISEGNLTRESAKELLQAFWIKFNNHPAPPKVGVTAKESNTYTDFCLINLGGVKPDGSDAVNELTFLILDVIEEMRLLQPSSMVQVSRVNPDAFIDRTLLITKTGFGQPSYFNTDAIVEELTRQGKSPEDARNGGASGCVEAGAFGTEAYILTGYFNIPKVLEITLNDGVDPMNGKQIGLKTGPAESFRDLHGLLDAFGQQLRHFIDIKIRGNEAIAGIFAERMPVPFLSLLIDDCIGTGKDYNAGGARYNSRYIQGVGLGTVTDCLAALKHHVFDRKTIGMAGFMKALQQDFHDFEEFRKELIYHTPKYGNDDDYTDEMAVKVFELYFGAIDGRPSFAGGTYRINLLPTTCHVYFGSVTGALPDGRKARQPLSEGISPVQGADTKGPTAVMKSAAKIDHTRTGGTLLNQKFTPSFFEGKDSIPKLRSLIRGYFAMNGHHVQFNVVTAETLREAQRHPEKFRDLIVRVAGYSDYFNDLGKDLQDEIIMRTEQGED